MERRKIQLVHPHLRLWAGAGQPFFFVATRPPEGTILPPVDLRPNIVGWLEDDGRVYAWVNREGELLDPVVEGWA